MPVLTSARFWYPSAAIVLAALLFAVFNTYWWSDAWDDMAITLGFARTFAETGIVAPTPLSAPVEGSPRFSGWR